MRLSSCENPFCKNKTTTNQKQSVTLNNKGGWEKKNATPRREKQKSKSKDAVALLLTLFGADQHNNQKENLYGTAD